MITNTNNKNFFKRGKGRRCGKNQIKKSDRQISVQEALELSPYLDSEYFMFGEYVAQIVGAKIKEKSSPIQEHIVIEIEFEYKCNEFVNRGTCSDWNIWNGYYDPTGEIRCK